jgi:hypothetical protein
VRGAVVDNSELELELELELVLVAASGGSRLGAR